MSDALWRLSACELAVGIQRRDFSSAEVMDSVLERVASRNPELNAIVYDHSDAARAAAREADAALAAGRIAGPLHGVPVTVKENVDVAGQPTPNGLPALESVIAPDDSPVVRNLRNAGAIIIGRTNTPELSMRATTDNPLHGRTLNPWDADASPGGSSGGASSAAAAGFGPIHHGNDIGGSLRFPSFTCGLATVKPTLGRVPAFNPSAGAERGMLAQLMSVQGAICREVRDVRLATRVMAGGDARDPWWVPAPFDGPTLPGPIRVAVTKQSHGYPIHPEIAAAVDRASAHLADAGYAVDEVETPSIMDPAQGWFDVAVHEIRETLGPLAREHGSETIQQIFEHYCRIGRVVDADGYRAGLARRTAYLRAWNTFLDQHPLVLSPFLMRPTYPWDYDARGFEQVQDLFMGAIWSVGVNYLSLPAGVVPIGMVEGLPAGVQIIGRRYREDVILGAMEAIEARVGILTHQLWARE
ncbi:MAG: amidase [Ectothiorhodospiraceae bacterium]|nr:amidase [Ectothiorhodospiraceae bacterium]